MIDVHRLRVLRAVVAAGSVTGAARALGYTPSAVSQHLTTLQHETALTLVEKRGRGIEPTEAGRTLAAEAGHALERLADLDGLVDDLRTGRVGSLSVHYFSSAGATWIPPVIAAISTEFPQLRLTLRLVELADPHTTPPDVEVCIEGTSALLPGHHEEPLLTEPYLVVLPDNHVLGGRSEVELAALRTERWVDNDVARGPCRQNLLDACSTLGFTPSFQLEAHDYPTAIRVVAAGIGVTVLPRLGLGTLPAGVVARPLANPTPTRTVLLRTRESVRNHPAVQRILELLRERATVPEAA